MASLVCSALVSTGTIGSFLLLRSWWLFVVRCCSHGEFLLGLTKLGVVRVKSD